jgi:hypothetical protein
MAKKETAPEAINEAQDEVINNEVPQEETISNEPVHIPSGGLGDTIASITSAVGIPPCKGCAERQEAYNRMFPYNRFHRPILESEIELINEVSSAENWNKENIDKVFELYNSIFEVDIQRTNHPESILTLIQRIKVHI